MNKDDDKFIYEDKDSDGELPENIEELLAAAGKKSEDEKDDKPSEAKYRDIELDKAIEAAKKAKKEAQILEEELAYEKEQEDALVHSIKGRTGKEKTRQQAVANLKGIRTAKKERANEIKEAIKATKKRRESLIDSLKNPKKALEKVARQAKEQIEKYKAYAKIAPGKQAGMFDQDMGKDAKRNLKHDFDLGAEVVTKEFSTTVDGVTVTGKVSTIMKDVDGDKIPDKVSSSVAEITEVRASKYDVSTAELGNLKNNAALNALNGNNKGGIDR